MALITTFKIDYSKSEVFRSPADLRRFWDDGMNRIFYSVDGLISRTNLYLEEEDRSGSISIFADRKSMEIYQKSQNYQGLFKMEESKEIDVQVHDIMPGSEKVAYLGVWPVSLGKFGLVPADVRDAWVLILSFKINFNKNQQVKSIEDYYKLIDSGFTELFIGIPGLRTKYFTVQDGQPRNRGSCLYYFT